MGIFDFFKKKPKFQDDLFGALGYITFKDESKNCYNGDIYFQGFSIGITIDADEKGPNKAQKDFFKTLDNEYVCIKEEIILPFLKEELADHIEESGLSKFDTEFELDSISIERFTNQEAVWSITYDAKPMRHFVTIDFEGMTRKNMNIDG